MNREVKISKALAALSRHLKHIKSTHKDLFGRYGACSHQLVYLPFLDKIVYWKRNQNKTV